MKSELENSQTLNSETVKSRPMLFSGEMVRAILAGTKSQTRRVIKFKAEGGMQNAETGMHPSQIDSATYDEDGWGTAKQKPRWCFNDAGAFNAILMDCPHGVPGDRIWVKETFTTYRGKTEAESRKTASILKSFFEGKVGAEDIVRKALEIPIGTGGLKTLYAADFGKWAYDKAADLGPWKPSIFMRRVLSRITLEIVSVRVERLQEITDEDAMAEGIAVTNITDEYSIHGGKTGRTKTHYKFYGKVLERLKQETSNPIWSYESLWNSINLKPSPNYVKRADGKKEIVSYQSYPWSEGSFDAKYPGVRAARMYRGKPIVVTANPWVWCIGFKRISHRGTEAPRRGGTDEPITNAK